MSYLGPLNNYNCRPTIDRPSEIEISPLYTVLFVFNNVEAVFLDVRRPNTAQLASDEART